MDLDRACPGRVHIGYVAEAPSPWIGPSTGRRCAPSRRLGEWTGRHFHLGTNKEAFDAELYAVCQATEIFEDRNESDQESTILTDSTATIQRAKSGDTGAGQRFAVATWKCAPGSANATHSCSDGSLVIWALRGTRSG